MQEWNGTTRWREEYFSTISGAHSLRARIHLKSLEVTTKSCPYLGVLAERNCKQELQSRKSSLMPSAAILKRWRIFRISSSKAEAYSCRYVSFPKSSLDRMRPKNLSFSVEYKMRTRPRMPSPMGYL